MQPGRDAKASELNSEIIEVIFLDQRGTVQVERGGGAKGGQGHAFSRAKAIASQHRIRLGNFEQKCHLRRVSSDQGNVVGIQQTVDATITAEGDACGACTELVHKGIQIN